MSKDVLRYDRMVENALKSVVREALEQVGEYGLPGAHHLYLTFATRHPGVRIPNSLIEKYPTEMTIVLQYQFWNLEVNEEWFAVALSFNDVQERLQIPFSAITAFADPSVNFALQFQIHEGVTQANTPIEVGIPLLPNAGKNDPESATKTDTKNLGKNTNNVVPLDAFRKD
ncbi:MAG: ClpXP protease specificity-enhancing factor SspB [Proteobacteria bacterium]|nr:ClpXP protease specificity-enhancing factor SspB [Pseudomonadota bacterium]